MKYISERVARLVMVAAVASTTLMGAAVPGSAEGFGTVDSIILGQRSEHERITRAALACAPGEKSTDGNCFEPRSIAQLAGETGTFGAVGAPDMNEVSGAHEAHCDDADFLDVPGYPRSRTQADTVILDCVRHIHEMFMQGRTRADALLKKDTFLDLPELDVKEADISKGCNFAGYIPGIAKCNVLESFGRVLHAVQDFYSHSNWTDVTDTSRPITIDNPPGLGLSAPSPLFTNLDGPATSIPAAYRNLTTGFFEGAFSDKCPSTSGRITHACMNKDRVLIDPASGATSDPRTPRGQIGTNAANAVAGAIAETKRQWADFRAAVMEEYGDVKGKLIISALTQDVPKVDLVFVIDTTGSMGPYISAVKSAAQNIVNTLTDEDHPVDYRIGVVDYKDLYSSCPSDGYAARLDLNFSSDKGSIIGAVNSLGATGGCDWPESVYSGLMKAIGLDWREGVSKAIVLMGDAPPHDPEPSTGYTADAVVDAAKGIATLKAMAAAEAAATGISIYPINIQGYGGMGPQIADIATRTGGKVLSIASASEVADAILEIIGEVTEPTNQPPAAHAGVDQVVACSGKPMTPVKLNGAASSDPDGDALTYEWSAPGVTFDGATSATPTGQFPTGVTTVTLKVSDGASESLDTVTIEVRPCIIINDGDAYTNKREVVLSLSMQGDPKAMRISNRPFGKHDWVPLWRSFAPELEWRLDGMDGKRTVYVQYKLANGSISDVFSDDIVLDSFKPAVRDVEINHGALSTHDADVRVTLRGRDRLSGVKYMRVGSSADLSGAEWKPYTDEFDWTLEPLEGGRMAVRRVYVQVKDEAQNISPVMQDSILLKP